MVSQQNAVENASPVNTNEILFELTHAKGLPGEAIRAATQRRAEMAPLFIKKIEDYLSGAPTSGTVASPLFLIFHIFGEWREKSAYRPLARLLRLPGDFLHDELGDAITETSHRVMAAVFDGDPQPLFDIALDPMADEYVRSRMFETIAMLTLRGEMDKALAARFLEDGFTRIEPKQDSFVWYGWQSAIAMLGLSDLIERVRQAFDLGYIDESLMDFEDFEEDLQAALHQQARGEYLPGKEYSLFGDTIEELSTWHYYSEKFAEEQKERLLQDDNKWALSLPNEPVINPYKGVGRNDPCPCGSGKKFKKCCL